MGSPLSTVGILADHRRPRRGGGGVDGWWGPLWQPHSGNGEGSPPYLSFTLPKPVSSPPTGGHKGPYSTSSPPPPLREDPRSQAVSPQIPTPNSGFPSLPILGRDKSGPYSIIARRISMIWSRNWAAFSNSNCLAALRICDSRSLISRRASSLGIPARAAATDLASSASTFTPLIALIRSVSDFTSFLIPRGVIWLSSLKL